VFENVADRALDSSLDRPGLVAELTLGLLGREPHRQPREGDLVTVEQPQGHRRTRGAVRNAEARRSSAGGARDHRERVPKRHVLATEQIALPAATPLPCQQMAARNVADADEIEAVPPR